jgi:hypothetical protein
LIVTALVTGAAAAAHSAVADAYQGLKALIVKRYRSVNVVLLEGDAPSEARRSVVAEDLRSAEAGSDTELLERVEQVLRAVEEQADQLETTGVDLQRIRSARLEVRRVLAEGSGVTGVKAHDIDVQGVVEITDVTAHSNGDGRPKP